MSVALVDFLIGRKTYGDLKVLFCDVTDLSTSFFVLVLVLRFAPIKKTDLTNKQNRNKGKHSFGKQSTRILEG